MQTKLDQWSKQVAFPAAATAQLGFGAEYWRADPSLYEGFEQLGARLQSLGRKTKRVDVVYQLTSHLLTDVLVAAGGVENSILRLHAAVEDLKAYVSKHKLTAVHGIPLGLAHPAAVTAWYAFSDVLSWSRTVVERMERPAGNRRKVSKEGLLPALKPERLRTRCEMLLATLRDGPVGQSRNLANFVLHTALVRHPHTGAQLELSGSITLPVPDLPRQQVSHWYLLSWQAEQDGLALANEIWLSVQEFIDGLINSFERSVPKRLRRPSQ